MELKKFKMVASRADALWRGKEVPKGTAVLVIAGESEDDVHWFFSKLDWSAWVLEPISDQIKTAQGKK